MIQKFTRRSSLLFPIAAILLLPASGYGADEIAKPADVVKLAYFPNVTHATALVGVARGTFAAAVAPSQLDVKTFTNGPALIEALFAGEVDIGYSGPRRSTAT